MHTTILEWRAEVAIRTFLRGDQLYHNGINATSFLFSAISDLRKTDRNVTGLHGHENTSGPERGPLIINKDGGSNLKVMYFLICLLYHAYDEIIPHL